MVLVQNDNFGDRAFFLRPRIARGEGEKVNLVVSSADLEFCCSSCVKFTLV